MTKDNNQVKSSRKEVCEQQSNTPTLVDGANEYAGSDIHTKQMQEILNGCGNKTIYSNNYPEVLLCGELTKKGRIAFCPKCKVKLSQSIKEKKMFLECLNEIYCQCGACADIIPKNKFTEETINDLTNAIKLGESNGK